MINKDEFGASSSQLVLNVHSPHLNPHIKEVDSHRSIDCSGRLSNLVRQMDDKFKDQEPTSLSIKSYQSEEP